MSKLVYKKGCSVNWMHMYTTPIIHLPSPPPSPLPLLVTPFWTLSSFYKNKNSSTPLLFPSDNSKMMLWFIRLQLEDPYLDFFFFARSLSLSGYFVQEFVAGRVKLLGSSRSIDWLCPSDSTVLTHRYSAEIMDCKWELIGERCDGGRE